MPPLRATKSSTLGLPGGGGVVELPGMTPRDLFFYHLGFTLTVATRPNFDRKMFILAAPDEETRLLGEVALELQIENLGDGDAARRLAENVVIRVGGKSVVRHRNNAPRRRGYPN